MKTLYQVREGFSLKVEGQADVYVGGGCIELTAEEFKTHEHKLEPISPERLAALEVERAAAAEDTVQRDLDADAARQKAADADAAIAKEIAKQAAAAASAAKGQVKASEATLTAAIAVTDQAEGAANTIAAQAL